MSTAVVKLRYHNFHPRMLQTTSLTVVCFTDVFFFTQAINNVASDSLSTGSSYDVALGYIPHALYAQNTPYLQGNKSRLLSKNIEYMYRVLI